MYIWGILSKTTFNNDKSLKISRVSYLPSLSPFQSTFKLQLPNPFVIGNAVTCIPRNRRGLTHSYTLSRLNPIWRGIRAVVLGAREAVIYYEPKISSMEDKLSGANFPICSGYDDVYCRLRGIEFRSAGCFERLSRVRD